LFNRFIDGTWQRKYTATIGVDFKQRVLSVEGKKVKFQVWDTAGQERYRSLTRAFYRGARVVIFVFDITSHKSFKNLSYWFGDVALEKGANMPK
jgi:small GTP-binding protein